MTLPNRLYKKEYPFSSYDYSHHPYVFDCCAFLRIFSLVRKDFILFQLAAHHEKIQNYKMAKKNTMGHRNKAEKRKSTGDTEQSSNPPKKIQKSDETTTAQKEEKDAVKSSNAIPSDDGAEKWSKSKKKRMRKILAQQKNKEGLHLPNTKAIHKASETVAVPHDSDQDAASAVTATAAEKKSPSIQDAFKARLAGSRFRMINEELYTTTSQESFDRFSQHPELYEQYHEGFRHQVESWPENPVDVIVRILAKTYSNNATNSQQSVVVADFGCGDAQLAKDLLQVKGKGGKCPFVVHSFDLVAPNDLVTACDMAHVPLPNESVDVGIFCLSLMGTNLADFVREAHRVLKRNGRLQIAEVRSRIEYSLSRKGEKRKSSNPNKQQQQQDKSKNKDHPKANNKTEGTLEEFVAVLDRLGFECVKTDRSNTMFLLLELKKNGKTPDKQLMFSAKPCIYKRR
jgi:ribosomal RNA-processing protein 8